MNITNIQPISASQSGSLWTLKVTYTATFTDQEKNPPLNYTFRDSIQIRESDTFSDDNITGLVAASNFNPSTNSVQRTLTTVVKGDDLDTELGGEEIYAKIQLRNFTTGGVPVVRRTPVINLSP
ncbi:hypothetical protein [Phormidesmis sp. 146-33]